MSDACAVRILSYGGGLDSFALLLGAIQRGERPTACVFVDVTDARRRDPGEWPSTYRHIEEVAAPLASAHGIDFVTIRTEDYPVRGERSLFRWLEARRQIPVAGPTRICTRVAKVERFEAWCADHFPGQPVEVWLGFEAGEEARAERDPNAGKVRGLRRNRYPLIEWGWCRCRAEAAVRAAGFPVPRKSACLYCPMGSRGDWQTLARELPDVFARVAQLEARKPPTRSGVRLSIMGFRTLRDDAGRIVGHRAPPLPEFIRTPYRPRARPCDVCGAAERASKATGCTYLEDA